MDDDFPSDFHHHPAALGRSRPLSTTMTGPFPIKINAGKDLSALAFSADEKYILNGYRYQKIDMWKVQDGQQVIMPMDSFGCLRCQCLAVSKNGRWIAAGTDKGEVFVWDAKTHDQLFQHQAGYRAIHGLNFSPSEVQLVCASEHGTATIWDLNTRQQVKTHRLEVPVFAAKFSPTGDQLATATEYSVQVWKEDGSHLSILIKVTPRSNNGLEWFHDSLFVVSSRAIQKLDTSNGTVVSTWEVPNSNASSCIALPNHGRFIVYSTGRTVVFSDMSAPRRPHLDRIEHSEEICSIALSPGSKFLAVATKNGSIIVKPLFQFSDFFPFSSPHPTLQDVTFRISRDSLVAWKYDELEKADALLTAELVDSQNTNYDVLAARALARACLKRCDAALTDAEMVIHRQPSIIAYIARSLAYIRMGKRDKAYQTCDIASERFHSTHATLLFLVKAIVVFMADEHDNAISRLGDLGATVTSDSTCSTVQAYMYLLMGNELMGRREYEGAIPLFRRAVAQMQQRPNQVPLVISLMSGWKFDDLHIIVRLRLCKALYEDDRAKDSSKVLREMVNTFDDEIFANEQLARRVSNFGARCMGNLEGSGDTATSHGRLGDAISDYSAAIALGSATRQSPIGFLIKRSKAYIAEGSWEQAKADANKITELDPDSPSGYERMHAALHLAGDHENAVIAYEAMLSKMSQSRDPTTLKLFGTYVHPSRIKKEIRDAVQAAIHELPRVLIDTVDGRLCDKSEQAASFESFHAFHELVSSMTTHIDTTRIKARVAEYYSYAMFSHKWEDNEPSFMEAKTKATVFNLGDSPACGKLKMFCKIVRKAKLRWAWSDTCCIDKANNLTLQEALVAMFQWYRGSALTIVFLCDVLSQSRRGALTRSIWNTRAWTFQEYHASKVVQFYTKDWTLYLGLNVPNHKHSPEIISEMQEAARVSKDVLISLQPGLNHIWEKLYLASKRQTSLVEDAAYSLLGIFSMYMPIIYGERERALGRLLAELLPSSGDTRILAWTGKSGDLNSCLPARITAFNHQSPPLFPVPMDFIQMDEIITRLASSPDADLAMDLSGRLRALGVPSFSGNRLALPCITFDITLELMTPGLDTSEFVLRSDTLGTVKIKTTEDLTRFESLTLVHPWIDFLRDKQRIEDVPRNSRLTLHGRPHSSTLPASATQRDTTPSPVRITRASTLPLSSASPQMKALELVARLRQPFCALLFTERSRDADEYRRIATDSQIIVQLQEDVSLRTLMDNIRKVDVL